MSVTEDLSIIGGQAAMEAKAKSGLQLWAAGKNADSIHITDRQLDKGHGGYDKTRLTLYGDLYNCNGSE